MDRIEISAKLAVSLAGQFSQIEPIGGIGQDFKMRCAPFSGSCLGNKVSKIKPPETGIV